ncbi:MAG: putative glycoside hydrolase [Actinomycetota bacterium]|nr:putative glycoside hydrolase [Actinomycetota bacterium]
MDQRKNSEIKVKGIYVTANSAGLEQRFQDFMDMIDATELNAMVIDVKNDHGVMAYPSEIEIVKEVMEDYFEPIRDIRNLLLRLEEKNIYPIARIVVFRDPHLSQFHPEWAIQKREGGVWVDRKGFTWMNPYEKKVWDYNIAIAKEAALMGFREIQFDYVRFPEDAENFDLQVELSSEKGLAKDEAIRDFLDYAQKQLKEYDVYVSADVFGVIATYITDKDGIGQSWEEITSVVDYIYPMVYPSHYGPGFFGLSVPDAKPRETILRAMEDAIKRNATVQNPAPIRPWLQGFTATWIKGNINYNPDRIREQIDAALDRGIEEFFIWNAWKPVRYTFFPDRGRSIRKAKTSKGIQGRFGLGPFATNQARSF